MNQNKDEYYLKEKMLLERERMGGILDGLNSARFIIAQNHLNPMLSSINLHEITQGDYRLTMLDAYLSSDSVSPEDKLKVKIMSEIMDEIKNEMDRLEGK